MILVSTFRMLLKLFSLLYLGQLLLVPTASASVEADDRQREVVLKLARAALASSEHHSIGAADQFVEDVNFLLNGTLSDEDKQSLQNEMTMAKQQQKSPEEHTDSESRAQPQTSQQHSQHPHLAIGKYMDRHIQRVLDIANDPECLTGEFDATAADFDPSEVARVYEKCRLVVIRNVFENNQNENDSSSTTTSSIMEELKHNLTRYVTALDEGLLGYDPIPTTLGESESYSERGSKRYEIMVPRDLTNEHILAHPTITNIFRDERLLGSMARTLGVGCLLSEPGALEGGWHTDDVYALGDGNFDMFGIAGHDLPPFALTVATPMLAGMSHDHGPTEFCLGSSHVQGLSYGDEDEDRSLVWNATLLEEQDELFSKLLAFVSPRAGHDDEDEDEEDDKFCPPQLHRAPVVERGDVVMFDYLITHRGGENRSPQTRTLFHMIFAREFYKDKSNFSPSGIDPTRTDEDDLTADELMLSDTRFAAIESFPDNRESLQPLESVNDFMLKEPRAPERQGEEVAVFVSNVDVPQAHLYVEEERLGIVEPGQTAEVEAHTGAVVSIRDEHGTVLRSWVLHDDSEQIMVSKQVLTT